MGNKVGISQDAGALTVVGVDADDSGTYICRAINLHGCSSDTADVSVVGMAHPHELFLIYNITVESGS